MQLVWHERGFAELTPAELYAIVALREQVFIVEQTCAFLDADGYDLKARHLWCEPAAPAVSHPHAREIHAYLRILPAGVKFAEISLGRIVTAPQARGTGLGRVLIKKALEAIGAMPVRMGAQAHLEKFYGEFGFRRASEVYDEDGIPHIEMLRA